MEMHRFVRTAMVTSFLGLMAVSSAKADERRNEFFVGTYSAVVVYSEVDLDEDEFAGNHFGYARDFNDHFGFRGSYFSVEHVDFPAIDVTGYDMALIGGKLDHGFNVWGGGGFFSEDLEDSDFGIQETFSGVQVQFGIGYSWEPVSLRFVLNSRDASDYADFKEENSYYYEDVSAVAISSNLNLGFRF